MPGGCADQGVRIRVAADDAVQNDRIGGRDAALARHEIAVEPLDSPLETVLGQERLRLLVVAVGELDDRHAPRAQLEQLEPDRTDAAADLEHRRTCDSPSRQLIDDQLSRPIEPFPPVAAGVSPGRPGPEEPLVSSRAAGTHAAGVYDPAMRILVAEDETIIRLDLRGLLERAGFEVCAEAKDGLEAVELARSEQPDLAVLDVKMPRLDGIEAARRILDERPIPIVMLTAYGQDELVSRAIEAGVFGYLVKPFREQDLLPAIRTARARHEELSALREQADSLAEALAARKSIERAKGLLMEREGLSEEEAFGRLRKASQLSGRPMRVVAEALLATFEAS